MKKILSAILTLALLFSAFVFTASAQEKYTAEQGNGYIAFDYYQITCGTVNGTPTATLTKGAKFNGKTALKVVPNPAEGGTSKISLDCYTIANYGKVEFPKYRYVGITYYYDTTEPSYDGKPAFRTLPGSTKAVTDKTYGSTEAITAGKWTEAVFPLGEITPANTEKPYLAQFHIRPFGDMQAQNLSENDVIYIEKLTFYENNPDPNAKGTISFDKASPGAEGEMAPITEKVGTKVKLPECAFTNTSGVFTGWRLRSGKDILQPGTEVTVTEGESIYDAIWDESGSAPEFVSLDFRSYAQGVVNSTGSAVVENDSSFGGKGAVKITPNPECDKSKRISVDGWSYAKAKVDLKVYKYFAIEYYFDTDRAIDATMNIAIMNQGKILAGSAEANATEPIKTKQWHTVYFDFSNAPLNPDLTSHIVGQLHVRILGEYPLSQLTADDVMYVSRIMFFKELPESTHHDSYMNGYEDGTFRPSGTMTRAEACTVVARLLEKEENIAGTSNFADVKGHWAEKYIGLCESKGLLSSYSGNFTPDTPITRAEFSELVYLTGLAKATDKAVSFSDVDASHAKYTSIMAAASAGLINGYDNGNGTFSFKPDNTITRAEVVTIINRARGTSKTIDDVNSDMILIFLDTDKTHWAFADIAEATIPHTESDGKWLSADKDPLVLLGEKFDVNAYYNIEAGNAKVAELDILEAKRIEEIRNTPSMDLSKITGKKIYVSYTTGHDDNDGLTENTPVKSLAQANKLAKSGDAVLLKRGDLWRGMLTAKGGVTYSAYGEGDKPKIYGSPENGADPEKWLLVYEDETGKKVWQYKNTDFKDVGTMIFRDGDKEYYTSKVMAYSVGERFVYKDDKNKDFDYIGELKLDLEFFHYANNVLSGSVIDATKATGPVFLRCDNGNPGKIFDSIEFNVRTSGIGISGSNVTIDNICVMHAGVHGISSGTTKNLTVTNCEFGWIGGSIQSYNANGNTDGSPTRLGNGVEIYGGCDGYLIDNCYLWQNYDAGVTHQYSSRSGGDCIMKNITYSNNLITDCIYSIEYFLSAAEGVERYGDNVLYENNLCRRAGYGFGGWLNRAHRGAAEHIRSGGTGTNNPFTNYRIINNIFDRSTYELCQTTTLWENCKPVYSGNTFIGGLGNNFYTYGSDAAFIDIASRVATATVLGDKTGTFYYVDKVPKNQFGYVPSKKAAVEEADKTRFANFFDFDEVLEQEIAEDNEVKAPLLVKTSKDGKLYADTRKSYTVSEGKDEATGIVYTHINLVNEAALLNFDCYGLPKFPIENDKIVVKILMRTTEKVKPQIFTYNHYTADGEKIVNGSSAVASMATSGSNDWEEVYVEVKGFPNGVVSGTQIHLVFGGAKKANEYFKDGQLIGNVNFDVAAWGIFTNYASAKAYDLKAAAVNGVATAE